MARLNDFVSRTGRTSTTHVNEILSRVEAEGEVSSNNALMLLRCFGAIMVDVTPQERVARAQKFWNNLKGYGVVIDVSHYNAILR